MPDVLTDRRNNARYPLILVAEISDISSGAKFRARSSDISRSGCYIDTLNPVPAGSKIRLRFLQNGEALDVNARVVYVSPGLGMGVAFEEPVAAAPLAVLERWLSEAARMTRR